jgi:hypothetical protein
MAMQPLEVDDLETVVLRARRQLVASGRHKAPATGLYASPLDAEERAAVLALLRNGTYREAARRVGEADPELADQ